MYQKLYNQGVSLVFLKEPHINTSTYQQAMENQLSVNVKTGDQASEELLSGIFGALNRYMLNLAKRQIQYSSLNRQRKKLPIYTKEHVKESRLRN